MSKKLSQGNEVLPMSKQLDIESIEKGEFVFYNSNEVTNLEVMVKNGCNFYFLELQPFLL